LLSGWLWWHYWLVQLGRLLRLLLLNQVPEFHKILR
jgi:hypothetical protein